MHQAQRIEHTHRVRAWAKRVLLAGAAIFVMALFWSAVLDPTIRLLHALQSLIYVAMLVLALISFQRAFRGKSRTGVGLDFEVLRNLAPGVAIMLVYVIFAAEFLGFYLGSFVAFLVLYALYDPQGHGDPQSWIRRAIISAGFITVMYLLFALVLKVQTPRGLLI